MNHQRKLICTLSQSTKRYKQRTLTEYQLPVYTFPTVLKITNDGVKIPLEFDFWNLAKQLM